MSQIHFTEAAVPVRTDEAGRAVRDASAGGMVPGLVGGIPFILGDDGAYDIQLNRFFRECPSMGVRSVNSVRAYAHDLLTWLRFLAERRGGKSVWHADRQDIIAFHRARRLTDGPGQIAGSSWNRSVTALEKFYGWAWDEELIGSTPFARGSAVTPSAPRHAQRRSRSFREPAARRHDMRFIGMDRFILFRDVGLRAHLPDGTVDPAWRGQNGERDALFAEFLTATGLRLEEASSLLPSDLPRHDDPLLGDARSCPVTLAPAICKGGKGREIRIPRRLLRRIDDYMTIERPNAVARWRARRGWERMGEPICALEMHSRSATIDGGGGRSTRRRLDVMRPRERGRLVLVGTDGMPAEPAALWLADNGAPMRPAGWEAAFLRGDARCQARGLDLHVTPHMLRHTFAVHTREHMVETAEGFLRHMNWQEHQALVVAHEDKEHAHVHLMINTVHPETGRHLDDNFDKRRAQKWGLEYEQENGRIYCQQRLENVAEREEAPTRPAWTAFHEKQKEFERDETMLANQASDLAEEGEGSKPSNFSDWKRLKEFQRQERMDFFGEGKSEFSELRRVINRDVREEFRGRWADYYSYAKVETDPIFLAEVKTQLVADQKVELEARRDEGCGMLREARDEQYQVLLEYQQETRSALRTRQDAGLDNAIFLELMEEGTLRDRWPALRTTVSAQSIVDEMRQEANAATADRRGEPTDRGFFEVVPDGLDRVEPSVTYGAAKGADIASDFGLGVIFFLDKIFDGGASANSNSRPSRDEPPPRDPFDGHAEETQKRQQAEKDEADGEWRKRQRQRSYGE